MILSCRRWKKLRLHMNCLTPDHSPFLRKGRWEIMYNAQEALRLFRRCCRRKTCCVRACAPGSCRPRGNRLCRLVPKGSGSPGAENDEDSVKTEQVIRGVCQQRGKSGENLYCGCTILLHWSKWPVYILMHAARTWNLTFDTNSDAKPNISGKTFAGWENWKTAFFFLAQPLFPQAQGLPHAPIEP